MSLISRSRRLVSQLKLGGAAKPVVGVLGGSIVLVGIAMLALPGPAVLVIPLGLAILATKFPWARRWLEKARGWLPKRNQRSAGHWRRFRLIPHRRYLAILGVLFALWWIALGIQPWDRGTWVLENSLALFLIGLLAIYHQRLLLSRMSYTLIFVFLCLHEVGAHYSYSEVPYDAWFAFLTGRSFNSVIGWERNNFDRVVHFAYGLFLAYPIREIFLRVVNVRGFWGYFLPLDLTMSTSMSFELLEWAVVGVFGGGLGQSYLGTQGDEWDAHKDMALASLGALVAMCITAAINWRLQRDFAREWVDSLRVKHKSPLGEDELVRMARKK